MCENLFSGAEKCSTGAFVRFCTFELWQWWHFFTHLLTASAFRATILSSESSREISRYNRTWAAYWNVTNKLWSLLLKLGIVLETKLVVLERDRLSATILVLLETCISRWWNLKSQRDICAVLLTINMLFLPWQLSWYVHLSIEILIIRDYMF